MPTSTPRVPTDSPGDKKLRKKLNGLIRGKKGDLATLDRRIRKLKSKRSKVLKELRGFQGRLGSLEARLRARRRKYARNKKKNK